MDFHSSLALQSGDNGIYLTESGPMKNEIIDETVQVLTEQSDVIFMAADATFMVATKGWFWVWGSEGGPEAAGGKV